MNYSQHPASNGVGLYAPFGGMSSLLGDAPLAPRPNILLGISGSVAAIKAPLLAIELLKLGNVKLVCTAHSRHFFDPSGMPLETQPALTDQDEWLSWQKMGDPVLHIELRRWADVLVLAPLSANTMAKVAHGLCDNLLTSVVRAWDYAKPMIVAPAMNTYMWESPLTVQQLGVLRSLGALVIEPVEKNLACGDMGKGAMAAPAIIAATVQEVLSFGRRPLATPSPYYSTALSPSSASAHTATPPTVAAPNPASAAGLGFSVLPPMAQHPLPLHLAAAGGGIDGVGGSPTAPPAAMAGPPLQRPRLADIVAAGPPHAPSAPAPAPAGPAAPYSNGEHRDPPPAPANHNGGQQQQQTPAGRQHAAAVAAAAAAAAVGRASGGASSAAARGARASGGAAPAPSKPSSSSSNNAPYPPGPPYSVVCRNLPATLTREQLIREFERIGPLWVDPSSGRKGLDTKQANPDAVYAFIDFANRESYEKCMGTELRLGGQKQTIEDHKGAQFRESNRRNKNAPIPSAKRSPKRG